MTPITLTNTQRVRLELPPIKNRKGGPAKLDGLLQWKLSDDTIASLEIHPDGLSALVSARGPLGSVDVVAEGDADLGAGVKPVFWTQAIVVVEGEAVGGDFIAGTPEEQPEA